MSQRRGFTFTEILVVIAALVVIVAIVSTVFRPNGREGMPPRAVCSATLRGLFTATMTYSVSNGDAYPMAGARDSALAAQGFRGTALAGRTGVPPTDLQMTNNVTASLFMLVRDASVSSKSWICPGTTDIKQVVTALATEWDFNGPNHLSYSPLNMYHCGIGKSWSAWADPDFILMADKNNATGPGVHMPKSTAAVENSSNHPGGQNVVFGDGHVEFVTDPYRGPGGDNIYAMTKSGVDAPPTLGLTDGDAATDPAIAEKDVVLIPLTGNNGVSLSGMKP